MFKNNNKPSAVYHADGTITFHEHSQLEGAYGDKMSFIYKHDLVILLKSERNNVYSKHAHQMCLSDHDYEGMSRMLELMHDKAQESYGLAYSNSWIKYYDVNVNNVDYIVGISAKPVDVVRAVSNIRMIEFEANHIKNVVNYLSMWKENVTQD
jgi:hypothetical protein